MSQDAMRRRSRGEVEEEAQREENISRTSSQHGREHVQAPDSLPDSKRRRPPSPTETGATSPVDHFAAGRSKMPTTPTPSDFPQSTNPRASPTGTGHQHLHPERGSGTSYQHSDGSGRHLPAAAQRRYSGSDRPETSSSTQSDSALGLARLPSLTSIAQDLPVNTFPSRQSPKGPSSPISTRSNPSRHSISSRGSSPHPSSSSSSSDTRKRRYDSHALDGAISRSAPQVSE